MAAGVVELEKEKSCCASLKSKYSKLEEKRNALRQAVQLLDNQVIKLENENANLRKENKDVLARLDTEKEARLKESTARVGLEKELSDLKSEISLLRKTAGSRNGKDDEVGLLHNRVVEGEAEINRLKELLEKEKKQVQSERKKVAEGKKNTMEMAVLQTRVSEIEAELSQLADLLEKEKKNVELEKKRAGVEKNKAVEAWNLVKTEKKKYEEQKKLADIERNRADEIKLQLESARAEADQTRLSLLAEAEETKQKLEARKRKLTSTKKHEESERKKTEEHRKCAEAERKKANDEKHRADALAQKLEVEMERNGALQKEIQEITSGRNRDKWLSESLNNNTETEMANMKLLEKQLKLEKVRVKLTKKMRNVEKLRNNMLQQEMCRLKQEFFQMSHRLNMLDGFVCHSNEGIDGPAKIDNLFDLQNINLKRKLSALKSYDLYDQCQNAQLGSMRESDGLWCVKSGGGRTKPISGISSESEPMVGCSVRNTSQNSAVHSTTASFSDRKLDSQEIGGFPVTTSANLAEDNLKQHLDILKISEDITEVRDKESLVEVAENNGVSLDHRNMGSPCLNCKFDTNTTVITGVPNSRRKRRNQEAVDSTKNLYDKDKKLCPMKEKPSKSHKMPNHKSDMPGPICSQTNGKSLALENGCPLASNLVDNLYAKACNSSRKRLVTPEQTLCQPLCVEDVSHKKSGKGGNEGGVDADVCTQATSPVDCFSRPCRARTIDAVISNYGEETWFENMAIRDCMKLLELDDAVDDKRYREAIETPMTPTLPEIESPFLGAYDDGKNFHDTACAIKTVHHQIGESGVEMAVAKQIPVPETEGTEIPSANNGAHIKAKTSKCYVVFSSTRDESCISRIVHSTETCLAQISMVSQQDWILPKILLAVLTEDLLPEEKACVFFTLLLFNFSVVDLVEVGNSSSGDYFSCSESFLAHVKTVMTDVESRRIFSELFELDSLLSLIEDFLIAGKVLVSSDVPCGSGFRINLFDGMTAFLSPRLASIDQLMVGSVILASICCAVDDVSFICDASHSILHTCQFGSSLILRVLHVFAYVCGEKYFTLSEYNLTMGVIKSIVSHVEEGNGSCGTITVPNVPSESNNCPMLSRCPKCPFAEGAVSVDEVLLLLLEKLQNHADSGIKQQNMIGSPNLFSHRVIPSLGTTTERLSIPAEDTPDMDCSGSACTIQSSSVVNGSLCNFGEILALVELVACIMNWEWTQRNIIPRLLEMVKSSIPEELSAAIFVLIGELGRLGVDARGYEKIGVEELKCDLSDCLNLTVTRKWGFPTQLAIVNSLMGLLSENFTLLVQNERVLSPGSHHSSHADTVRKWFAELSKEQKSLSISLLQSASGT